MGKFDALTAGGIFVGLTVLAAAMFMGADFAFEGVTAFVSATSLFIVVGGLSSALAVNYTLTELKGLITIAKQAFYEKDSEIIGLIQTFSNLATKARREGLLALEQEAEELEDPFIKKGILLAVDGIEPELIKEIMQAEVIAVEERHQRGINILSKAGELAPAFGMLGTIVGLVLMLRNLDDPDTIGPKMAIALITTFYGSLLANLVFIPMAGKLTNKSEREIFIRQIAIEGVLGVQSGQNPKILEEKLKAFLSTSEREIYEQALEDAANDKGEDLGA
ncbi:MotA/TolQ/ExbB proton channel family protein [Desulfuribacillus alkaliarsenatis]|uniref:Flagellar motor protein MotP n=1 Tax=Desulfuribacillus alkaliarsenatis TaxID=766136 RepID=A0A1E5G567_9FIRM|nr:MotA/TolQ/ExbB proton channel family protein [Desulfuribacillus alkaliarsenatis]OEF98255.1 flagellar motor protein MotP [Desulfuribacillus alkaliarsenatis]